MKKKIIIIVLIGVVALAILIIFLLKKDKVTPGTNNNSEVVEKTSNIKSYTCIKNTDDINFITTENVGNGLTASVIVDVGKYSMSQTYTFSINNTYNMTEESLVEEYVFEKIDGYNYDKSEDKHQDWEVSNNQDTLTKKYTLNDAPIDYNSSYMNEDGTSNYIAYIESLGYSCTIDAN